MDWEGKTHVPCEIFNSFRALAGSLLGFLFVVDTPLKATTIILTRYQLIQFPLWRCTDLQNLLVSPPPHNQDHLPKSAARSLCHLLQSLCTAFRRHPSAHTTPVLRSHPLMSGTPPLWRRSVPGAEKTALPCKREQLCWARKPCQQPLASARLDPPHQRRSLSTQAGPCLKRCGSTVIFPFDWLRFMDWHQNKNCLISVTLVLICTLLKINVLYWHRWFHEEPLTSMKPFHCTKVSYRGKRFKNERFTERFFGEPKMVRQWNHYKSPLWNLYFEESKELPLNIALLYSEVSCPFS